MILAAEDEDFETLASQGQVQGRLVASDGIAPPPVMAMLRALANKIRPDRNPAGWWMVEDEIVVGLCSITARPDDATIDLGYGVAASCQGRGAASGAVREILAWARTRGDLDRVTAETSTANPGSQRVLERNGFQRTGTRTDAEDGDLICWSIAV